MAARLNKVHDLTPMQRIEAFLERHALLFLCIAMIILFILVTCLVVTVFGASVTGTEANGYYYHLGDII